MLLYHVTPRVGVIISRDSGGDTEGWCYYIT